MNTPHKQQAVLSIEPQPWSSEATIVPVAPVYRAVTIINYIQVQLKKTKNIMKMSNLFRSGSPGCFNSALLDLKSASP